MDRQLRGRGIGDERVLAAMEAVPRDLFVPEPIRERSYADAALPIGSGQTISQPWIVAAICEALGLRGAGTVLEIGGGSGYSAAVLAQLCERVISIERLAELAAEAGRALGELGLGPERVEVLVGDGSLGHPPAAPYEAIAVHAATPAPPRTLLGQLAPGGRLVAPVDRDGGEVLTAFVRDEATPELVHERRIAPCRFVPLLGAEGYAER